MKWLLDVDVWRYKRAGGVSQFFSNEQVTEYPDNRSDHDLHCDSMLVLILSEGLRHRERVLGRIGGELVGRKIR